ncbi:hypothetical protein B566_EDAN003658 [Ephemera danica]|nr:hypothetical protein B566_EDAN003658 [Ephemera danica]
MNSAMALSLYNVGRFAGYRIGHLKHFYEISNKSPTVKSIYHTHPREIHSHQSTQQDHIITDYVNENYDVIIAGGGMVGTTLACALGQNPMLCEKRILLLEGAAYQQYEPKEKYSNRVSALNDSTRRLLKQIGAWQYIEATRLCQVKKMQVWEATSDSVISFNNPQLEKPVAYIVENDVLLDAVSRQLSCTKIQVQYNSKIQACDLSQPDKLSRVKLQSGEQFTCKLLCISIIHRRGRIVGASDSPSLP